MSTTFCALFEIALSIERFAAIVKPRRYHFSDFAWLILLPLTVAFVSYHFKAQLEGRIYRWQFVSESMLAYTVVVHFFLITIKTKKNAELGGVYPYIGLALLALIEVFVLAVRQFLS